MSITIKDESEGQKVASCRIIFPDSEKGFLMPNLSRNLI
jgi:hypothetical protein